MRKQEPTHKLTEPAGKHRTVLGMGVPGAEMLADLDGRADAGAPVAVLATTTAENGRGRYLIEGSDGRPWWAWVYAEALRRIEPEEQAQRIVQDGAYLLDTYSMRRTAADWRCPSCGCALKSIAPSGLCVCAKGHSSW